MLRPLLLAAAALALTALAAAWALRAGTAPAGAEGDRPITCGETVAGPEGPVLWMGAACLEARAGGDPLPPDCLRTRGAARGYDPACMAAAGWRVSGDD